MLKLLGVVLMIGACGALGLSARQRLCARIAALGAMLDALDHIAAELSYQQTPLPELIAQLARSDETRTARLFGEMERRMACGAGLGLSYHWQTTMRDLYAEIGLEESDAQALRQCAGYLGRYQTEQQLIGLRHTRVKLERERENACETLRSRGNLYRTCGLAAGIVLVLVLL